MACVLSLEVGRRTGTSGFGCHDQVLNWNRYRNRHQRKTTTQHLTIQSQETNCTECHLSFQAGESNFDSQGQLVLGLSLNTSQPYERQKSFPQPNQRLCAFHRTEFPRWNADSSMGLQHSLSQVDRLSEQTNRARTQSVEVHPIAAARQANHALCDDHGVLQRWRSREDGCLRATSTTDLSNKVACNIDQYPCGSMRAFCPGLTCSMADWSHAPLISMEYYNLGGSPSWERHQDQSHKGSERIKGLGEAFRIIRWKGWTLDGPRSRSLVAPWSNICMVLLDDSGI